MTDLTLTIIITLSALAGMLIAAIWREARAGAPRLSMDDLAAWQAQTRRIESERRQPLRVIGSALLIVSAILVTSWAGHRDDVARAAHDDDPRLSAALDRYGCPAPSRTGTVIMTLGRQADGHAPEVWCVEIDSLLGRVYELRRHPPLVYAGADESAAP